MIADNTNLQLSYPIFISLLKEKNALLIDVKDDLTKGLVKNALYIAFNDKFKVLLPGVVKQLETPLLLIVDPTKTEELLLALKEVGYTNVLGYLEGGFETWVKNSGEVATFTSITAEDFKSLYEKQADEIIVLDVRNKPEWDNGILPKTRLISLKEIEQEIISGKLEDLKKKEFYVFCQLGGRSMMASSILQKYGFEKFNYVVGGLKKLLDIGMTIVKE